MSGIAYKNKVAVVYLLAFFIDLVNLFIATIAFPRIGVDLHASFGQLSWIANSYSLALALIIPASAWMSDRYGVKNIFMIALGGSLVAVLLCGLTNSITMLIVWRFFQGLFGGLLIPVGQTMVYQEFPTRERAKLSAIIMAVAAIAPAISPTIGGFIVDSLSWRWIFFVNIPVLLIILVLSRLWLKKEFIAKYVRFNVTGILLISISLILIIYALSSFSNVADMKRSVVYFAVGVVLMILFCMHSLKTDHPLLNLTVMKNKLFSVGMVLYLCMPGVFLGISILNIFLFQSVFGLSAAQTGLLMLPFAAANFIAVSTGGKFFNRTGPRPILITSFCLWIIGLLLLLTLASAHDYFLGIISYFLLGLGSGGAAYSAQTMSMLTISNEDLSKASAIWNLNRQLSFCLGVAIFAMIFQLLLSAHGIEGIQHITNPAALVAVFHECFIIACAITIIPIISAFCFNNRSVLDAVTSKTDKQIAAAVAEEKADHLPH